MSEYDTANEHELCFQIGKIKRRIAELEGEVTRLLTERDDAIMAEARYIAEVELAKKDTRIAELEAEIDMLKQLSQPIEFWSDEKIQIYKSNESRTMKSGNEERDE